MAHDALRRLQIMVQRACRARCSAAIRRRHEKSGFHAVSYAQRSIAMTAIDPLARDCEPHALDVRTSGTRHSCLLHAFWV
ncbi:hypothetical protein C9397_01090 [Xanthomonas vasicola pv. vasculorum]|nr:hypothetical protein CQW50_19650 [Xanthomonas vasicola pv. vasculorum]PUE67841.1 hypothetical protein C7Y63_22435 [Xanthomonas vasicola pv. vasculorum]RNK40264.1 hypothetical protein C9401_19305 [Xanthomonas vasicola pv. vasculorum]RNK55565.1 hypothetical protein C9393_11510 [Xanthomonas vasicola pv. vasculorum]RNK68562.1 hypothetical protein C9394_08090 [Xanthomonas vasicola pv. vasculorum]